MKTKNLTRLFSFFFFLSSFLGLETWDLKLGTCSAQSPNWAWAQSAGGTVWDAGNSVSTDASGNVYITGSFASPSVTFGTTTLTNTGGVDIFIVKYDASGNVLWAQSAGGTSDDLGYSISIPQGGTDVYLTGYFKSSSITFGTTTLTNANAGSGDIFIVKYNASGNVLWAKSAGGTSDDWGISVSTDADSNMYITGAFYSPTITFGTTTLTSAGGADIFIVKYDASGNVLWAKSAGGTSDDDGRSVSIPQGGTDVYITGFFRSNSITFGTTTLTNAGGGWGDIFIVKYDASGNVLWAKSAGGTSYDYGSSVSIPQGGTDVYITGFFWSSSITFGTTTLTNADNTGNTTDIFVVKYDALGNVLWAKSAGGTSYDYGISVSVPQGGTDVYITGYFNSPSITFGTTTLTNAGGDDIFIVKYDASGNVLWAQSAGGTSSDYSRSVSTDAGGNVYITGSFGSNSITFGTTTLTNAGNYDIFIAKLDNVTGVNEWSGEESISVYPNPTSGEFQIQLVRQKDGLSQSGATGNWQLASSQKQEASIEVYNVYGEKVTRSVIPSGERNLNINMSSYPTGIYFLHISTEQGRAVKKIIINK